MTDYQINRRQIHIIDYHISESLAVSIAQAQRELNEIKQSIANLKLSGDSFRTMAISYADSFLRGGDRDDISQLKDLAIAYTAAAMALKQGVDLSKDWVLQKIGIPIQPNSSSAQQSEEEGVEEIEVVKAA